MPFLFQIQFAGGLILAKIIQWQGEGAFQDEVVGESHYQAAVRSLAGGQKRKRVTARLICERDNPYDAHAVKVEIDGQVVGHLPRERARLHRQRLARLNETGSAVECDAVIVAGFEGACGVWLDLPVTVRGQNTQPADARVEVQPTTPTVKPRRDWLPVFVVLLAAFGLGLLTNSALLGLVGFFGLIGLGVLRVTGR